MSGEQLTKFELVINLKTAEPPRTGADKDHQRLLGFVEFLRG